MLVSTAITNIKTATSHDSDSQVSGDQYLAMLQLEQDRVRAKLSAAVKNLYTTTAAFTLTSVQDTIAKPAAFLSLVRLEKLEGANYYAVDPGDGLDTSGMTNGLSFREEAANFILSPVGTAAGTYRLTYVTKGATLTSTLTTVPGADSSLDVPPECEDLVCERVCIRVRERCYEDPSSHVKRADDLWKEVLPVVKKRYGKHPEPGLRRVRGDT